MRRRRVVSILFVGIGALAAACSDTAGPSGSTAAAAGIYLLQSVNGVQVGHGDAEDTRSGVIYLLPDGAAERHVEYRVGSGTRHLGSKGTYTVNGKSIMLALRENDGRSDYLLHWIASLDGHSLTLVYPNPADGEIHEVYRRR